MADVVASVGIDDSEAMKAIAELAKRIDALLAKAGVIRIDADTTAAVKSVAGARTKMEQALGAVDIKTNVDVSGALNTMRNASGQFVKAGQDIGDQTAKGFKGQFAQIGGTLKDSLSGAFGGALLGGGIAGAITTGVDLLRQGVTAVIDLGTEFETGMQSLSAVTGATGPLLDDLGNRARNLATQFGGSANDQLQVFQTTLSKIGPQLAESPEALGKFAENVNILGKTDSALGAAGAVDALTGAMLQFGVDVNNSNEVAAESSRFINVLAASAAVGSASVSQVAEAVAVVGATAKNANVSFEETNAALQVLASKSLVGSQAGTGLTTVLNKLQAQSGDGDKALRALGTSSAELGQLLNTGGIGPAISKLREAMKNLGTQAEKNALLNKLFGEGGQNAAAALLGGEEMLAQFTKGVTNTNSATEQASINMSTLSETWSRVVARIQDVAIGVYQAVAPVLQTIISLLTNTLGPVFARLSDTIGGAFSRVASILKPILAVIGGIIIQNIVTTITYVTTVLSTMYDIFTRAFDAVKNAIKPAVDAIMSLTGGMGDAIDPVKAFQDVLEIVTTVISETGKVVADVAGVVIEFAVSGIQFLAAAVAKLIGFFKSQNEESDELNKNTEKGVPILEKIKQVFDNVRGTINGVTFAFREIKTVIMEFFDALTSLDIQKALASFTGFGERVKKAYDEGFNSVQRQRKEAEDAAAAEAARAEAAEKAEAAAEAAANTSGKKAKDEGTALEQALKLYKEQTDAIDKKSKALKLEAEAQLAAGRITQQAFDNLVRADESEALTKKYESALSTFKTTVDDLGLFIKTDIRLNKDETDIEIRTVLAELAAKRTYNVPVRITPVTDDITVDLSESAIEAAKKAQSRIKPLVFTPEVDDSLFKTDDLFAKIFDIGSSLTGAVTDKITGVGKAAQKVNEEQIASLKAQLKSGEIAYVDYAKKVDEIYKGSGESVGFFESLVAKANEKISATLGALLDKTAAKYTDLATKVADGNATINDAFGLMATTAGLSFAQMVVDGENAFKAMLLAALDALQALIPVLVAQITGVNLAAVDNAATFGASGLARAGIFTALLQGLVTVARSAVEGFYTGGLVTGGERTIRVNERGPEYVVNTQATRAYQPLLDAMNYGTPLRADIARKLNLDKLGITFAGQTERGVNAVQVIEAARDERKLLKRMDALHAETVALRRVAEEQSYEIKQLRAERETAVTTNVSVAFNERDLERRMMDRQFKAMARL